jgi:Predicted metal-dependent hydrolases related to alanyl-tRNA synthetase HxxxH domain
MTEWLFQQDAYLQCCSARVLETAPGEVVLDRTVFYPLGGGQPGDTGVLRAADGREWRVLDTRKGEGGRVLHKLAPDATLPSVGEEVEASLDWDRRYLHMRMHTGLHLMGSVLRFGVTGGQIAADRSRLDFDTQEEIDVAHVNRQLQSLVASDLAVTCRWIADEELDRQPELVRTLSVQPPRGAGRIRLLDVAGIDLQPCGGTHVRSTGEVGTLVVTKIENKGRHNRRVYVAFA